MENKTIRGGPLIIWGGRGPNWKKKLFGGSPKKKKLSKGPPKKKFHRSILLKKNSFVGSPKKKISFAKTRTTPPPDD